MLLGMLAVARMANERGQLHSPLWRLQYLTFCPWAYATGMVTHSDSPIEFASVPGFEYLVTQDGVQQY